MLKVNNKIVVVFGVVFCSIILYFGIFKETNSNQVTPSNTPEDSQEYTTLEESVKQSPSFSPQVPSEDQSSTETAAEPLTSETKDETIAKLWFDLRSDKSVDLERVTQFKESFEDYLDSGLMPQVVEAFPATIVTDADFGYSVLRVSTLTGTLNIVSAILPTMEGRPKVLTFLQNITDRGVSIMTIDNLDMLPSERGVKYLSDGTVVFFAGQKVNSSMYSDDGSVMLMGVKVNNLDITMLDMLPVLGNFLGKLDNSGNFLEVYSSEDRIVFSYNENSGEGQVEDDLYLVEETSNSSTMYKLNYLDGNVEAELYKESERW